MNDDYRKKLPDAMKEPMGFIALYDSFVGWMQKKNYSPQTIYGYSHHLHRFFSWCAERSIMSPAEVTVQVIEHFQKHLQNRLSAQGVPLAPATRYAALNTLAAFFKWLFKKGLLLTNPARTIVFPKIERVPLPVLTHPEMEEVIGRPDLETEVGIRNRAMLETLYSTGIRRRELAMLTIDDIDIDRGLVFVREGKGQKQRLVPIGERALRWIEKYLLEARPLLVKDFEERTLFISRLGLPFPLQSLTEIIGDYVHKCGLQGSCHLFRRTAATLMLENGAPVGDVQNFLGHLDIATTRFYTNVSLDKLKEVVDETHPGTSIDPQSIQSPIASFVPPKGEKPVPPRKPAQNPKYMQEPLGECVVRYLRWMQEHDYCTHTVYKRGRHLDRFLDWCHERDITAPHRITRAVLDCYQNHLLNQKKKDGRYLSAVFRKRILISLGMFLRFLFERETIALDPETAIDLPKTSRKLPCLMTQAEVHKILSRPDIQTPLGIRDRTVLETLYACALHSQELVNLRLEDIDLERATLHVHGSQNRQERVLPLTESSLPWLRRYILDVRPAMASDSSVRSLFLGKYGKPMSNDTLHEILRKYIAAAEIGKNGSCRSFRYTAAVFMLENGADIRYVQEFLGHKVLSSTSDYNKFTIHKLKEIHDKTHPAKMYPTQGETVRRELQTDPQA